MKKILISGGIVLEHQFFVDRVPQINEVALSDQKFNFGLTSKVINAGRILAQNNHVSILGVVGKDADGKFALKELKKFGIKTNLVSSTNRDYTGQVIMQTDQAGTSATTVYLGANKLNLYSPKNNFKQFDAYYLATSMPLKTLYLALKNKADSVITFLDIPNKHQLLDWNKLNKLDFLTANRFEAELMLQTKIVTIDQAFAAAAELKNKIEGTVIISLDKDGCVIYNENIKTHIAAPHLTSLDSTGAGDILRGVFLNEYLKNRAIVASAKKAIGIAAQSVKIKGVYNSIEFVLKTLAL